MPLVFFFLNETIILNVSAGLGYDSMFIVLLVSRLFQGIVATLWITAGVLQIQLFYCIMKGEI